jgi:regulator of replication initiation timing
MLVSNVKTSVKVTFSVILALLIALPTGYTLQQTVFANQELKGKVSELESQIESLSNQTTDLRKQVSNFLDANASILSEIEDFQRLQTEMANLKNGTSGLQVELTDLQSKINEMKTPKLVTSLGATDYRPASLEYRLYIQGKVWNVGVETASNSSLHVTMYRGSLVVNDTYIMLGDLTGASWKDLDTNIHYSGSALTNWTIIPEFNP